ncbi:MAG: PglZ domain-containing protein [Cyclobacteriaceae bacterium]|nr:PglZ domain-containing protein [Cyclobacteriaceae bacterium]MCH8515361.1 PglZ domain-containing protein [Cyclobacteriaceae bacterium]
MQKYTILWADDEIDLLKPHILFLNDKGYDVTPVNSGYDAIEECDNNNYDIIFLDENMPGMSGLEALAKIKAKHPSLPVVMITKSEEEHIMEEAIGSQIADYLIKPLNPNQILLSAKKILDNKRLVTEKTNLSYQQDFRNISMAFMDRMDHNEWADVYKKLIRWELAIDQTETRSMGEVLDNQKEEANINFVKFIKENYEDWLNDPSVDRPLLSHQLLDQKVFPLLKKEQKVFFIVIDNLRYDQWKTLQPAISEMYHVEEEDSFYSILPTTTAYSRNAIFSGLTPLDMAKFHPDIWVGEDQPDEGKNNHEDEFLKRQLDKKRINVKWTYHKIKTVQDGRNLLDGFNNLRHNDFNVAVINFVDMLSHARTDMQMIRELAPDEAAYRSLTKSWFDHSSFLELLRKLQSTDFKVIITTDHGTVRVQKPTKIIGDRNTNTNLRFKQGKNLNCDESDVYITRNPEKLKLPKTNVSSSYVFAEGNKFFAYPNNFNYYVNYYKDTFQHGGISLEEMVIPIITLNPKK